MSTTAGATSGATTASRAALARPSDRGSLPSDSMSTFAASRPARRGAPPRASPRVSPRSRRPRGACVRRGRPAGSHLTAPSATLAWTTPTSRWSSRASTSASPTRLARAATWASSPRRRPRRGRSLRLRPVGLVLGRTHRGPPPGLHRFTSSAPSTAPTTSLPSSSPSSTSGSPPPKIPRGVGTSTRSPTPTPTAPASTRRSTGTLTCSESSWDPRCWTTPSPNRRGSARCTRDSPDACSTRARRRCGPNARDRSKPLGGRGPSRTRARPRCPGKDWRSCLWRT